MRSHASHELKANIYRVYPMKKVIDSSYNNPLTLAMASGVGLSTG